MKSTKGVSTCICHFGHRFEKQLLNVMVHQTDVDVTTYVLFH